MDQKQMDREIRERAQLKAMLPDVTLEDLTFEEERELGMIDQPKLRALRVAAFERRASQFELTHDVRAFVGAQVAQYGPKVRVWNNTMSWLAAFLVVRYGENLTHWPSRDASGKRQFSDADNQRARSWAIRNEWPDGVTPVPRDSK
jgi:hypothetical protein